MPVPIRRRGRERPQALTSDSPYNPFISHDFLSSLELSGSARPRTGWQPMHLLVEDEQGELLGAAPCYAKSHSQGEYVFDHGWADAYERAGGSYYPKLQVVGAVHAGHRPPAAGAARGRRPRRCARRWPAGLPRSAGARRRRPVHVTFLPEPEWRSWASTAICGAPHHQFHWENAGYATFDDFLAALVLAQAQDHPARADATRWRPASAIHWLTGADLTEGVWDAFFDFYMDTGSRKWGRPYLTREFYSLVGEKMADRILLVMARRNGRWIAGAINFIGGDTLFGRHWGCDRAPAVPAFRALLLSGHRLRHRAQARAGRSRRAGPAQDRPRLPAGDHLFGALHRRPGAAARDRRLPGAGARHIEAEIEDSPSSPVSQRRAAAQP